LARDDGLAHAFPDWVLESEKPAERVALHRLDVRGGVGRELLRGDSDHLVTGVRIGCYPLAPGVERCRRAKCEHRFRRTFHRGEASLAAAFVNDRLPASRLGE